LDIHVGCAFVFDLAVATHGVVLVEPHPEPTRIGNVRDGQFTTEPPLGSAVYLDAFGNRCRRITLPAGTTELVYDATVEVSPQADPVVVEAHVHAPDELPSDTLQFLLPSRFCESDLLAQVATEQFGAIPPGWQQVQAVSDWVHAQVTFDYQSSSPTHTATSVFHDRRGVCRDFTHLGIALCRALNLPTRYVCGYIPDIDVPDLGAPMDFCAWMEVYLGGEWHAFDPRNNERRIGRIVVARGRDAADVAMVTTFGRAELVGMTVWADEVPATR